jgi:hypothetical protein
LTELATREKANGNTVATRPTQFNLTVNDIWMLAENVAEAKMFKGFDTPSKVFTLMMICESENMHPMMAVKIYDFIETGRGVQVTLKSQAIQARFIERGGHIEIVRADKQEARAIFSHPRLQPKPIEMHYDLEMAKQAGTAGKDTYRQNPEDMLWHRLVSKVCTKIDPGIRTGIPTSTEVYEEIDAENLPSPEIRARIAEAKAAVAEGKPPLPPADVEVIGYAGTGFDDRPYHQVAADAVDAFNAQARLAWQEAMGPDGPKPEPVAVNDMHRELLFMATNVGHYEGAKPARMTEALKALAGLYRSHRDWVRAEVQRYLQSKAEANEEALAAASATRQRDQGDASDGPGGEDLSGEGAGDDARES